MLSNILDVLLANILWILLVNILDVLLANILDVLVANILWILLANILDVLVANILNVLLSYILDPKLNSTKRIFIFSLYLSNGGLVPFCTKMDLMATIICILESDSVSLGKKSVLPKQMATYFYYLLIFE
jgi:hypothetical protein